MNWDQVRGNWQEMKGKAKETWGRLNDDELAEAEGDREQLEGLLRQKYGKTKEEARDAIDRWLAEA
ncbi:uncharacterized protein YjbJ (UPF0337 family) [Aliiruegeria haliotis]|uniref:Uncharacterized protein YjbJ (UPF0337 family) n=1 Tax=Aliiruegeria haliotis TaxID=1280846 RepID=A0A2T0RPL4_9RHOB|nr:CsbD family protein [Aliiruegeria haliotis]PRY23135.1 uncharacterized protein YjbJ (UPF0337 family) [Aliiruegeria haliotis]